MNQDRILGLGVLFFCALCWFYLLPAYVEGEAAQLYPKYIILFLSLASLCLCARRSPSLENESVPEKTKILKKQATLKLVFLMALYLGYLLLIPQIGFFTCSIVAAGVFLYLLGARGIKPLVIVPAILLMCVHLVIERALNFDLPNGILI